MQGVMTFTKYENNKFTQNTFILGARKALLRLQLTYNITIEDMGKGKIRERQGVTLTPDDFYNLGLVAQDTEDYGLSAQWIEYALNDPRFTGYVPDVLIDLAEAYFQMTAYNQAAEIAKLSAKVQRDKQNETNSDRIEFYKAQNMTFHMENEDVIKAPVTPSEWPRALPDWFEKYEILCNDDNELSLHRSPALFCIIRNKNNYYSWAKQEVLSQNPFVAIIYDVITDQESAKFINLSKLIFYVFIFRN